MTRNVALLLASLLLVPALSPAARAAGDVNFILGRKMLDDNDWAPVDGQDEFGAQMSFWQEDWPVSLAVDVLGSTDERTAYDPTFGLNATLEGSTVELAVGVHKIWERNKVRPFVGGGLAAIDGEIKLTVLGVPVSEDDGALGFWASGGVFWRLGKRFNIGFEGRVSRAQITLFGVDVEAGGGHFGMLLGWGW